VFGEDSQKLSPLTKSRIGFLMEGHIQYPFMTIRQIEKFYAAFYKNWQKSAYYELMAQLDVDHNQKISTMSCGQRSQVALGLILAQNPDLMILDDYSMGLDAGYRRLFLDYLREYAVAEDKTIFITSHIIQDLEALVEDIVILGYRNILYMGKVKDLHDNFKQFRFELKNSGHFDIFKDEVITNSEIIKNNAAIYSFNDQDNVEKYLESKKIEFKNFREIPMTLEDAFIGITGKY
jgi:ABC-2 type transport system ATP-binding protein